jgi:hypothetical protein
MFSDASRIYRGKGIDMPNCVTNILTIRNGSSERIREIAESVQNDELGVGSIDFNKIIPVKQAVAVDFRKILSIKGVIEGILRTRHIT